MRKSLLSFAIVILSVPLAYGSSINGKLIITPDVAGGGLYDVAVQVQSNGTADPSTNGDGGVANLQFDVLSVGTGNINAVPAGPTGPNFTKVSMTYNQAVVPAASFGTQKVAAKKDVGPADNPIGAAGVPFYVSDGDLDAPAAVLSDSGATDATTQVGVSGFQTIATELWQMTPAGVTNGETLELVLSGGFYYDFTASQTNFLVAYDTNGTAQASIQGVPEPASLALLGFGALSLVGLKLRRRS